MSSFFTVRVYLEKLQWFFLKFLFFFSFIEYKDFVLLVKMYKNKKNVMDFIGKVKNEFTDWSA